MVDKELDMSGEHAEEVDEKEVEVEGSSALAVSGSLVAP
jgi:hypothetical protein